MMTGIQEWLERMAPEAAINEIAAVLKKVLPLVSDEERLNFVMQIVGGAGHDKVASMVHL